MKFFPFWLSTKVWFLKLKVWFSSIVFGIEKAVFSLRENLSETAKDLYILLALLRTTISSVMFASLVLTLLFLFGNLSGFVESTNFDSYDNLLIAVASISGVFLSLYFTGLNTVIGGFYAKSPSAVRNLFIQERIGNFSVKFIISITLVALGLLLFGVTLNIRPKIAGYFIVVTGSFSILFFAQLGKRAFYFFDPTGFSRQLLTDLDHWSRQATSNGTFFTNPAFQNYYHRNAEVVLEGFVGLNKVALSEDQLKDEALSSFISNVVLAYIAYLYTKRKIPTKSRWFSYISKYKEWYLSSETILHIAALAKAELFPTNEPDHYWLENGFESIEVEAIRVSSINELNKTTANILTSLFSQFAELGKAGEVNQGILLHKKLSQTLQKHLEKKLPPLNELQFEQDDVLQIVGTLEALCSYLVTLVAGYFSLFDSLHPDKSSIKIQGHNWTKASSPYTLGFPFKLLPEIEDLCYRLSFEHRVEKGLVTSEWYIKELIARNVAFFTVEGISTLITYGINFFLLNLSSFDSEKQIIKSVVVIDRGLEMSEKLNTLVNTGQNLLVALHQLKTIDLTWPKWNQDDNLKTIDKFQKELITRLASYLPELSFIKRTDRVPDYFGKSLVIIGYECFRSLETNDHSYFQSLFSKFFFGCLLTYQNINKATEEWYIDNRLIALSEPVVDLFVMSGYSMLYAELHQNQELWDETKKVWDNFLNKEESKQFLQVLESLHSYRKDSIGITPRDQVRTHWEMAFLHKLKSLPRVPVETNPFMGLFSVADHPSEIIQIAAGHDDLFMLSYHADEVFIDLYLCRHESAKHLKFKLRNPISETIAHREKQKTKRKSKRQTDQSD